jgi:hypothetical protein
MECSGRHVGSWSARRGVTGMRVLEPTIKAKSPPSDMSLRMGD